MRTFHFVLGCALAIAATACADPSNDNVSLEGPSRSSTTTGPEGTEATTTSTTEATTTVPPGPVEVGRWSGAIDTDTENFTVKESWELHWRIPYDGTGAGIGIEWKDPAVEYGGGGLIQPGTPEGSTLIRAGGTFYLHISLYGAKTYEVWAVDIPN